MSVRYRFKSSFPSSYDAYSGLKKIMAKQSGKKKGRDSRWRGAKYNQPAVQYKHSGACRRHVALDNSTTSATRSLYSLALLDIPKRDSTFGLNSRSRDIINLVGFNIQYNIRNASVIPLLCNIAVIAIRTNTSVSGTNFFRGDGATDRGVDFGASRTPLELHLLPINTDDYAVLAHERFTLATVPGATNDGVKSFECKQLWVPCKRQVRYDASGNPHQRIFAVWWCDQTTRNRFDGAVANVMPYQIRAEAFFHDIS